ncbi:G-protein coupled receptor 161-like [Patiria miniata]|uniref:G-protein coupled receptors family 1 profile domain-containing protein n=1 Tax=Patiria miniata TaxID=46514 RepID=A0A914AI53_PATMI|nr:G-protein coupled receptor 161-like [Patiria miniata]
MTTTTNSTDTSIPGTDEGITQAEIVVYVIILVIESTTSILGSALVCGTFMCVKTLSSKPTSKLIVNLAVSDAAMGALVLPFTAATVVNQDWIYGHALCQIQGLLKTFLSQVQRSTMLLIAVDRLLRIRYRYSYGMNRTRVMLYPILITWALNLVLAVPPLAGWGKFTWLPNKPSCTVDWLDSLSYSITFLTVFGFALQFLITACYFLIFVEVRASRRRVQQSAMLSLRADRPASSGPATDRSNTPVAGESAPPETGRRNPPANPFMSKEEVAVARTMIILVTLSTLLSLPYIISNLISLIMNAHLSYRNELIISMTVYLNSCLNPVIYGATNSRFRQGFRTVVRCSCRRQR